MKMKRFSPKNVESDWFEAMLGFQKRHLNNQENIRVNGPHPNTKM